LRQLGLSAPSGFIGGLLTALILVVLTPVVGALSDRYGRIPIMIGTAIAILIASYPIFAWLAAAPTLQTLLIIQFIVGVLTACYLGVLPALMSELFPVQFRTTGLSVSYALGVAGFGGFAPFIHAWSINVTGSILAPSYYLIFAAVISLITLLRARRLGFS
jgi:MHS family proline/betaine transporter-like MFS transporter